MKIGKEFFCVIILIKIDTLKVYLPAAWEVRTGTWTGASATNNVCAGD
jgi:hypothetical protein